jgi:KDO2-lipid IV(A) lauroyltransferase
MLANPLFNAFVASNRAKLGVHMINEREMVAQVPRRLAQGHVIPMLADQGAKGITGIFVNFFGRLARTPKGPAVMALRLDAACVFGAAVREADGKFRLYVEPVPIVSTGDRDRDVETIVTAYTELLEKYVRLYPGQYLWQHRRWRRRPDGSLEDV